MKIWWDWINVASFGNPGYSTVTFVLASIYVNYETNQYRIGFLIIIVVYSKEVKIEHLQNMLMSHSEKQNLAPRN